MKRKRFNCLILAAGYGTRLGKYGEEVPKGLISYRSIQENHGLQPVDELNAYMPSSLEKPRLSRRGGCNRKTTLLGKLLGDLIDENSDVNIVIVTNASFFDKYKSWLKENKYLNRLELINDNTLVPQERLGAIGDIAFSLDKLNWWKKDLFVFPSDTYYDFPLTDFINKCFSKKYNFVNVVRKIPKAMIKNRLGCAVLKKDRIIDFVEKPDKPESNFASIPFYFYSSKALILLRKYLNSGENRDAPGSIIPYLIKNGLNVYAYKTSEMTMDIGTLSDVNKLKKLN